MQRLMAMMPGHISCKQFDERLDDYMEGELSLAGRLRMAGHKIVCGACRAYAAAYAKTIAAVKRSIADEDTPVADEPVPDEVVHEILRKRLEGSGQ